MCSRTHVHNISALVTKFTKPQCSPAVQGIFPKWPMWSIHFAIAMHLLSGWGCHLHSDNLHNAFAAFPPRALQANLYL
jgi:hypothetical protein